MNYQFIPFPFNFYGVWYSSQVNVTMASPTFKGYMDNIQIKTGQDRTRLLETCQQERFVKRGKVASKHSEMLARLKSKEIEFFDFELNQSLNEDNIVSINKEV